MRHKNGHLWPVWCAVLLALPAVAETRVIGAPVPPEASRFEYAGSRLRLDEILGIIESSNAPQLVGAERWNSLVAQRREAIERASSHKEFAEALNELIKAGGVSHFGYYTDQEWLYWFMRSTFYYDTPESEVEHVGIFPQRIDGRWFVRGVFEGTPAASTVIRVGDEVLTVDGSPYDPVGSFRGKAGQATNVRVCRRPGLILNVMLTPVRGSTFKAAQEAMHNSIRVIRHDGYEMAYLHAWTLLGGGSEYQRLAELQGDVDGLLLDYRDGFGGMWDVAGSFLLGPRQSDGTRGQPDWAKPVVILTDDGTRSAKEIVVHQVKEVGRAPLVGAPTPGSVVSIGGVYLVGDDGLLMVPGHRFELEGNPTEPDFLVRRDIRYCAGADPQLALAREVLAGLIRAAQPAADAAAQICRLRQAG